MASSAGVSAGHRPREERRALLKGARCYVVAYGCARAWATLTFTGPWQFLPVGFDPHVTFDASYVAVSLLVALLFRKVVPLNERRWLLRLVLGCMVAASAGCIAVGLVPAGAAAPLAVASSLAAGVGYGLFPAAGCRGAVHVQPPARVSVHDGGHAFGRGPVVSVSGHGRPAAVCGAGRFAPSGHGLPAACLWGHSPLPNARATPFRAFPTLGSCLRSMPCMPLPTACAPISWSRAPEPIRPFRPPWSRVRCS